MLTFRGGTIGALTPFVVFLGGVSALAAAGAPDEKGFWPVLLLALIVGLLLAHDRARFADAMLDGMSQRIVMVMLCAWLFAGVLGSLLAASGFVDALAWGARALNLTAGAYVGAAFVACALVATATGTSFGTILVAGPLLYPAGGAAGAAPAALIGAILAGATWGDSMSPVSDTTIASSGTQGADIGGTVRARLKYALPAGLVALVASVLLGGQTSASVAVASELPINGGPMPLVMLVVPALVIAMLLAKRHLVESLLVGVLAAAVTALAFGLLAPRDLLRVEPGSFGATGVILDGFNRAIGVSIFTLLLMALVGTIQATDLLERLVRAVERRATSARGAEAWIVGTVSAAVMLTTHSVVAVLMTGPFAKETGERHGISAYRRANLLDLTVCTWPFLLPWFLPTILASGATREAIGLGMPALSPLVVGMHNTYAWALLVVVGVAVVTGYGRRRLVPGVTAALLLLTASACSPGAAPPSDSLANEESIKADYVVPATPENLSWGWFPVDKEPVITVRPGDVVEMNTLTTFGAAGSSEPVTNLGEIGIAASDVPEELVAFWKTRESWPREGRNGHLITGPVYIEGAEPGDVLEVQILDVRPRVPWGVNFTRARSGVLSESYPGYRAGDPPLDIPPETPDREPEDFHIIRTVTVEGRDYGVWDSGVRVPLAPFMGILAVAPDMSTEHYGVDVPGVRRSGPPGRFGGNLDIKHLTAGTSVFLPVFHPGARFFVGDPHGAQGDGEVSGTAIEQSMIGTFRFLIHKNGSITQPRGESRTHHMIMGLDTDLDRAMRNATFEVVTFLVAHYGLRPSEAFSVASVAVDFTVSEAVDGVQVITALIPKSIFPDSLRGRR